VHQDNVGDIYRLALLRCNMQKDNGLQCLMRAPRFAAWPSCRSVTPSMSGSFFGLGRWLFLVLGVLCKPATWAWENRPAQAGPNQRGPARPSTRISKKSPSLTDARHHQPALPHHRRLFFFNLRREPSRLASHPDTRPPLWPDKAQSLPDPGCPRCHVRATQQQTRRESFRPQRRGIDAPPFALLVLSERNTSTATVFLDDSARLPTRSPRHRRIPARDGLCCRPRLARRELGRRCGQPAPG